MSASLLKPKKKKDERVMRERIILSFCAKYFVLQKFLRSQINTCDQRELPLPKWKKMTFFIKFSDYKQKKNSKIIIFKFLEFASPKMVLRIRLCF